MTEQTKSSAQNSSLNKNGSYAMMDSSIVVSRHDLELEHNNLIQRIQHLRQILGYAPLPTGKKQREGADR